ncbi:hypothetical protein NIES4074_61720 (plasmid) [Cylindrospermum sp. NIES-4074]|nr:hypothetical protein NIES4074_61720 [Cylindrospermum sp. NIES-4074]
MNKRECLKEAVKISPKNGKESDPAWNDKNLNKPEIGTICTIASGHKKHIGEPGYVCSYHQSDSLEFWVKLDNHDLQIRCLPEQIKISPKNEGDRISIPDGWVDKGGLWDKYPQYWLEDGETYFYDGEKIYSNSNNQEII